MNLFIKQKVFSWKTRFAVKGENEEDCYFVEGKLFSWGKKLYVFDRSNQEVAFLKQRLFTFLPRYEIHIAGIKQAEVVKEFTFFKPQYTIEGLNWQVEGDFWGHDYQILQGGRVVAFIQKKWFTWGDSYMLSIENEKDQVMALCVVLAIDCVLDAQSQSAASSSS